MEPGQVGSSQVTMTQCINCDDTMTQARWHPFKWTCFKLDLSALKSRIGASRLRKISLLSRLQGGIRIQVHKAGQAYDENIGAEITSGISADPRYYLLSFVDLALKVKKIIPRKHQQCEDTNYDEKLLAKTAERMMSTAGNVFHSNYSVRDSSGTLRAFLIIRLRRSLCGQNDQLSHL